jgi:hypothetical protein
MAVNTSLPVTMAPSTSVVTTRLLALPVATASSGTALSVYSIALSVPHAACSS